MLSDVSAERAVLAGVTQSNDAFLDVDFLLHSDTFTDETNQILWSCIKSIRSEDINAVIDWPLLKSKGYELGFDKVFDNPNESAYAKKLLNFSIEPSNVRKFASVIRKLEVARLLYDQLEVAKDEISKIKGNESVDSIIALAENRLFDFSSMLLDSQEGGIVHVSDGALEYFEYLLHNERDIIGISTGLPIWDAILGGCRRKAVNMVAARAGVGKCFGINTPILMFNGTIKNVQDVQAGDLLMGPDSKPRKVLGTTKGYGNLYNIEPTKGMSYVVNADHMLSLKHTVSNKIVNISVKDFLKKSGKFKQDHKSWRTKVEWNKKDVLIPPYILGVWLGDGHSRCTCITTADIEIKAEFEKYAEYLKLNWREVCTRGKAKTYYIHKKRGSKNYKGNTFFNNLKEYNLILNKHIPQCYLSNDRETRLELLAGLIDTDGHLINDCYEITSKRPQLAKDVLFLARSLGFAAYSTLKSSVCQNGNGGIYHRICISGNISDIPTKIPYKKARTRRQIKNVLKTGISINQVEDGEYYGFEVDGDHLFLLGDFTVTHNSMIADNIALHVAGKLDIPVLYLDTEMSKDGHWHRMWANISNVPSREIENGKFGRNELKIRNVRSAVEFVNSIPYYYVDISGKAFEETLAYIRRWLIKDVGYDDNGRTKDCLIIYDYLKMMNSGGLSAEMKEFQVLGFQMTSLHNFAVKFDVPILSFVQLNRDGIDKESTDTISQSDRIVWLASSLSIYKPKSDKEIAVTSNEGNRKLIVVKNRFGPINAHGEYINIKADGSIAKITEGRLSSEVPLPQKETSKKEEFDTEDDNETETEFSGNGRKIKYN